MSELFRFDNALVIVVDDCGIHLRFHSKSFSQCRKSEKEGRLKCGTFSQNMPSRARFIRWLMSVDEKCTYWKGEKTKLFIIQFYIKALRIFWILSFLFAFWACLNLIYQTYVNWENNPMLVSFNQRTTPNWQIPFPAITICPESSKTNADKFKLSNVVRKLQKSDRLTESEVAGFEALYQICDIIYDIADESATKHNYADELIRIQNEFYSVSTASVASKSDKDFKKNFHEVITDEGVCHTFNMLDEKDLYTDSMTQKLRYPKHGIRSNWTIYGYDTDARTGTYPTRVLGSGVKAGVFIKLKMRKKDVDYVCKGGDNGFRLVFHTPDEIPQPGAHYYLIPFNTLTVMSVQPRVMTTSAEMRRYPPIKRQCFFENERKLKYFKTYTQANCKLEFLAGEVIFSRENLSFSTKIFPDYILDECDCVKFSMPHKNDTSICDHTKAACVEKAENHYVEFESIIQSRKFRAVEKRVQTLGAVQKGCPRKPYKCIF